MFFLNTYFFPLCEIQSIYWSIYLFRSVIYLCSFLPHSSALTIASFCLSKLKSAQIASYDKYPCWTDEQNFKHNQNIVFTTYVDALCNWRRGDDILEIIIHWLNSYVKEKLEKTVSKPKKRGVRFDEAGSQKPRPGYGLLLLRYMLSHSLNKAILIKKNFKQLEDIKDTLQVNNEFEKKPKDYHGLCSTRLQNFMGLLKEHQTLFFSKPW